MIRLLTRFLAATLLVLVAAAVLASCAPQGREILVRDATGASRGQAALEADLARCEYEFELARAGSAPYPFKSGSRATDNLATAFLSAPPASLIDSCMAARGWRKIR